VVAKIKFCGIMQPEDATVGVEAGAAYLGVVFAGGPRTVTVVGAREVVRTAAGVPVLDPHTIARSVEAVFAHSSVT
jgi:phosphoribosylanthranilate isomerase